MSRLLANNNKSFKKIGNKNPQWKGNQVGYTALHEWIRNRLPKPESCENCHAREPHDLANKNNK